MHFQILTLFPDFFTAPLQESILEKAQEKDVFSWKTTNIRDFSTHPNGNIDDAPYGGGGGMVIQAEPVAKAIESVKNKKNTNVGAQNIVPDLDQSEVIYFSPSGKKFTQEMAKSFSENGKDKILVCGHYEGIDERVIATQVDHCISIGEAVLTGGEIPALYFLDSVVRLLPDAIGQKKSHEEETFSENFYGKGEYPHFTRPQVWKDLRVPQVLTSGDAQKIKDWRFAHLKNIDESEEKILELRRKKFAPEKMWKVSRKLLEKQRVECLLRTPLKDDITAWYKWFNDEEVTKYMRLAGCTWEEEIDYYHFQYYNLHMLTLAIIDKKSKKLLGNASLEIFPEKPFEASFGIVLGEKDCWNKGYATAVTLEMLSIAQHDLGLTKVRLDVFIENTAAQKVYEKCGFEKIGTSKKYYEKNGDFFDVVLYEKVF